MLHELLKILRESRKTEIEDLANQLGLHPFIISGLESRTIVPTEKILKLYSLHFGIPEKALNFFADLKRDSLLESLRFIVASFLFRRIKNNHE